MIYAEVKEQALRHVAAWLRDEPTEGPLWEGVEGSFLDSFQPDDAGRRAAAQFTRALDEIASALDAEAEAVHAEETRKGLASAARRAGREDAAREARLVAEVAATQGRYRRLLAGEGEA